jgi:hypothetical protein
LFTTASIFSNARPDYALNCVKYLEKMAKTKRIHRGGVATLKRNYGSRMVGLNLAPINYVPVTLSSPVNIESQYNRYVKKYTHASHQSGPVSFAPNPFNMARRVRLESVETAPSPKQITERNAPRFTVKMRKQRKNATNKNRRIRRT